MAQVLVRRDVFSRSRMDMSARLGSLAPALVTVVALGLFLVFGQCQWFLVDECNWCGL